MPKAEIKNFNTPDEQQEVDKASVATLNMSGGPVERSTLKSGWRWSEHIKPMAGTELCEVNHFGYIVSGQLGIRLVDGTELVARAGDVIAVPAGHDAWVIGDEPVVAIDWGAAANFGK
ncbi:MAG: cupin domain-containing protein [Chloroflexota bacterium]